MADALPISTSFISPPRTTIVKKNHGKNCDISNLCIELVVKEMSQWAVQSRRAAALFNECLPSRRRCTVPAIRTLQAKLESQKHKALQRGAYAVSNSVCLQTSGQNPLQSSAVTSPRSSTAAAYWPHPHDKYTTNLCQRSTTLSLLYHFSLSVSLESFHLAPYWTRRLHLERTSDKTDGKCQNLLLIKDAYCCTVLGIHWDRQRGR